MLAGDYLTVRHHPFAPLAIANYTAKAAYDRVWNDTTLQCRGLIFNNETREVVARPFKKFFNWGEEGSVVPVGPYVVREKVDGSLGILYETPPTPDACFEARFRIATRGSFESEQANHATRVLLQRYFRTFHPDPSLTYLFEIVFSKNKIVVDYGDLDDLILLDVLDTTTGEPTGDHGGWPGPVVETHPRRSITELLAEDRPNREGYVLYWPHEDYRLKVKHDTYKRLHRLLTGVTPKTIWEALARGESIIDEIELVPDEWHDWVRGVEADLRRQYHEIEAAALERYQEEIRHARTRKDIAFNIEGFAYRSLVFLMLDGRDYEQQIWRLIKPSGSAYRQQEEAA